MIETGIKFALSVSGSGLSQLSRGLSDLKRDAGAAGRSLKDAFTPINQAMEIGSKAARVFGEAMRATVGEALALRGATDPTKRAFAEFEESVTKTKVAIGDALAPAFGALILGLKPTIDALGAFVTRNRELVNTKTIEWLTSAGRAMVTVFAVGIKGALTAVSGLMQATNLLKLSWMGFHKAFLFAQAEFHAEAARTAGDWKYAREHLVKYAELRKQIQAIDAEADVTVLDTARLDSDLRRTTALVDDAAVTIFEGFSRAEDSVKSLVDTTVDGGAKIAATLKGDMTAQVDAWRSALAQRERDFEESVDAEVAIKERFAAQDLANARETLRIQRAAQEKARDDERRKREQSTAREVDARKALTSSISGALSGELSQIILFGKTAEQVFESLGQTILNAILNKSIEAAIGGLFDIFTGGIGGSIISGIGSVFGLANGGAVPGRGVVGFATGGPVLGVDSVPALLMPGEVVVPAAKVRENIRAGKTPAGEGGGGATINVTVDASSRSFVPESQAAFDRRIRRQLLPSLRRSLAGGSL